MNSSIKRILPIALVAALLGGSVGALVMRAPKMAETASTMNSAAPDLSDNTSATDQALPVNFDNTTAGLNDQGAYRNGFEEGFIAGQENRAGSLTYRTASGGSATRSTAATRARSVSNGYSESQGYVNNTQPQPRKRSFWEKHRDKLTVAAGAGGGALIGGLIGGKKGALIGGLAGGGGSALYTYKLRKKTPQY